MQKTKGGGRKRVQKKKSEGGRQLVQKMEGGLGVASVERREGENGNECSKLRGNGNSKCRKEGGRKATSAENWGEGE